MPQQNHWQSGDKEGNIVISIYPQDQEEVQKIKVFLNKEGMSYEVSNE